MISATAHLSFTVSDLESSLRFYRDLLGFRVVFQAERSGPITETIIGIPGVQIKIAMLVLNDFHLELIQYLSPKGKKLELKTNNIGCAHLAFYVEDIGKMHRFLSASGVLFKSTPHEIKEGPLSGYKAVYFFDPDGITLELMQPPVA